MVIAVWVEQVFLANYDFETVMNFHPFSFISGSILCFLAVLIGAFGAHGLESLLISNNRVNTFETASHYHFFHALALLIIAVINSPEKFDLTLDWASRSLCIGVIIFSGSLYILAVTNLSFFGAITPIGGLFFLIDWVAFN